ncbi:MAG: pseudouridine synthase [Oligoflexia bacterium]|nr:pseudouridine synthase [Oligoflexia bacterium]
MQFNVPKTDRVDRLIRDRQFIGSEWVSRASWDDLFLSKKISSKNKGVLKSGDTVNKDDIVSVELPFSHIGLLVAESDVERVYRSPDKKWGVFLKKPMLNSISLRPWLNDSLASEVAGFLEKAGEMSAEQFSYLAAPPILEGGLVQRLDYETSGLVCVAFTKPSKVLLQKLFIEKKVAKEYLAIVLGEIEKDWSGQLYFQAHKKSDTVSVSTERKKQTDVSYSFNLKVCSKNAGYSLVLVRLQEGFRHVVRASMAALGHALYADPVYGQKVDGEFFSLHASTLICEEISLNIKALPPQSFLSRLEKFGLHYTV